METENNNNRKHLSTSVYWSEPSLHHWVEFIMDICKED